MNREKFFRNLVIAVALVLVAGLAGQLRRMETEQTRSTLQIVRRADIARRFEGGTFARPDLARPDVLVRFRPGVTAGMIDALTATLNDGVQDRYEAIGGLTAIRDFDGIEAGAVAAQYRELSDLVEYAEPDTIILREPPVGGGIVPERSFGRYPAGGAAAPDDPMFAEQWGLANTGQREGRTGGDINALKAWTQTKGDAELVVAVLDSGVEYTHPDLAENIWQRPDSLPAYTDAELGTINDRFGYNADANNGDPMDDNGHGTHCAGIVGAVGDNGVGIAGVNWRVKIMPLKFMGRGGFGTTKNAIEAINYTIARKKAGVPVRVISASWGSTAYSRALEDAIRKAGEAGILFVAAAGNSSQNTDRVKHYPASYDLPNVLSIAALNRRDELASFSNYGVNTVHLAAPGAEIVSTWLGGKYFEASGTSMATPMVSGIAALVLAVNPDLTVKELRARLLESVDPLDTLQGKIVSGGRLNAARAVNAK